MKFTTLSRKFILTGLHIMAAFLPAAAHAGAGRGDYHVAKDGQSIDDLVIEFMDTNQIPGMSVAIVQAPYITRVVGYGFADQEKKTLVASRTVFNVGQLTNAFTGVAIMQLKEEGKLNLDDPMTKYLPWAPQSWSKVTIRHCLTHTSGIAGYDKAASFSYAGEHSKDQMIALLKNEPVQFEPGTRFSNSTTDAYLLGLIVEAASGQTYETYVNRNQFERIGLQHTFFLSTLKNMRNELGNGTQPAAHKRFLHESALINPTEPATGYDEKNNSLVATPGNDWNATFASSGIAASAEDISLWDIALAGDILLKDAEDRSFLYRPVTLKNGTQAPGNSGWLFPGHKGLMEIKGNVPGYSAFLSRFTAANELLCVTLLANRSDVVDLDVLARKIAAAYDRQLGTPDSAHWVGSVQSPYSVSETIDRAAALVKANGGKVFARIDHSAEAGAVHQDLRPTQVLMFGNPAVGTTLMQSRSSIALDLPLRIMATQDESGQVWLSFTDPQPLAAAYGFGQTDEALLQRMSLALRRLVQATISANSV